MKYTALYDKHLLLNAKMVSFAGYSMPISYSSIIDEHNAVRNMIGVFDVSHMGEFKVSGLGAENFLQLITINDVKKIFFLDGMPYCKNILTGENIMFHNLQFQGGAKSLIKDFLRRAKC